MPRSSRPSCWRSAVNASKRSWEKSTERENVGAFFLRRIAQYLSNFGQTDSVQVHLAAPPARQHFYFLGKRRNQPLREFVTDLCQSIADLDDLGDLDRRKNSKLRRLNDGRGTNSVPGHHNSSNTYLGFSGAQGRRRSPYGVQLVASSPVGMGPPSCRWLPPEASQTERVIRNLVGEMKIVQEHENAILEVDEPPVVPPGVKSPCPPKHSN